MKKWYAPCQWVLLAAMTTQLIGCASTARTVGRWTGRDKSDEQIAAKETPSSKSDKVASKSAKGSKAATDDKLVADAGKSTKKVDPKAATAKSTSKDDALVADGRAARPKAAVKSAEEIPAKESTTVAKVTPAKTTKPAAAPQMSSPFDEIDRMESTALSEDPFSQFSAEDDVPAPAQGFAKRDLAKKEAPLAESPFGKTQVADAQIDETPEFESQAGSVQLSSGVLKPKSANAKVAQGTHLLTPAAPPAARKAAVEVAQASGSRAGLPEWALESGPTRPQASEISQTAATSLQPGQATVPEPTTARSAFSDFEPIQTAAASIDQPVTSKAAPATTLPQCPDAQGEVKELVKGLETRDLEALKRSIHRLGRMQEHAASSAPALEALLKHNDGFVRVHAALALVRMNVVSSGVSQTLIESLRSPDPGIRSFAAAVLAEMGPGSEDALPALSAGLSDSDGYVRLHVAEVLIRNEQWSQQALRVINGSLDNSDENVRWLATYSLAELAPQSEDSVKALRKALKDPAGKVQVGAAYALGEIGALAASAVPDLERCRQAPNEELKSAADYALSQIQR